jgi:hypothetical protein
MGNSVLRCNAFDLHAETLNGQNHVFDYLCGCPMTNTACAAVSASLEAPEPPE